MRVLIAEHDHAVYARLLRQAAPELEVLTSGDSAELARLAADCPVWLGQPDLLATLLRQGHQPQWLQSTWAGITPLLADGLPGFSLDMQWSQHTDQDSAQTWFREQIVKVCAEQGLA